MKARKLSKMRGNEEIHFDTYRFGHARERERERKRRIYESLLHTLAIFWCFSFSVDVQCKAINISSHSFFLQLTSYLRNDFFPLTLSGFVILSVVIFTKVSTAIMRIFIVSPCVSSFLLPKSFWSIIQYDNRMSWANILSEKSILWCYSILRSINKLSKIVVTSNIRKMWFTQNS